MQSFARRTGHVDVQRLRLIDPLLPARCTLDQPRGLNLEGGRVDVAQLCRDAIDPCERSVKELQICHHHLVPEPQPLEIAHQVFVDDGELSRQVGLHIQVLEGRLDAGGNADDVGDRGGGRDGDAVGIAHPELTDTTAQRSPVEPLGFIDLNVAAALFAQQTNRVLRQDAAVPQRAFEA